MNIPIILGTAREGRQSAHVAKYILNIVKVAGHESAILDAKDLAPAVTDNSGAGPKAKKYKAAITKADAVIIITPEYNHGYPGELKLLLDSLYKEYTGKPVGFVGVSAGPLGGSRAVEQLRQVVIELRMIPVREAVYIAGVQNVIDENGMISDETMDKRVLTLLADLERHVR